MKTFVLSDQRKRAGMNKGPRTVNRTTFSRSELRCLFAKKRFQFQHCAPGISSGGNILSIARVTRTQFCGIALIPDAVILKKCRRWLKAALRWKLGQI